MEIIPAIMPKKYPDLVDMTKCVTSVVDWVQIDVMDGKYTQSISWPYAKGSRHFDEILGGDEGLPHWEDLNFELDLMVRDPYAEAPRWLAAGASRIILHWGSLQKGDRRSLIHTLREAGIEVGLALVPHEDVRDIDDFLSDIDCVQFMGIDRIGFQGEPFVDEVIDTVKMFKEKYPEMLVQIDGGINEETAVAFAQAGADRIISGSFIFTYQDGVRDAIQTLKDATK